MGRLTNWGNDNRTIIHRTIAIFTTPLPMIGFVNCYQHFSTVITNEVIKEVNAAFISLLLKIAREKDQANGRLPHEPSNLGLLCIDQIQTSRAPTWAWLLAIILRSLSRVTFTIQRHNYHVHVHFHVHCQVFTKVSFIIFLYQN